MKQNMASFIIKISSKEYADPSKHRTPNKACPACQSFKMHTPTQWAKYHPLAGTGIQVNAKI